VNLIGLERLPDFLDGPFELKFPDSSRDNPLKSSLSTNFSDMSVTNEQNRNLYKNVNLEENGSSFSITAGPDFGILTWDFELISGNQADASAEMCAR